MKTFRYNKDNGETSMRTVVVLKEPSDSYLTLDVSSLCDKEKVEVSTFIEKLQRKFLDTIKDAGYSKLYRRFKQENIY